MWLRFKRASKHAFGPHAPSTPGFIPGMHRGRAGGGARSEETEIETLFSRDKSLTMPIICKEAGRYPGSIARCEDGLLYGVGPCSQVAVGDPS
ncbi:hypothetical protein PWT90_10006 [Aphanocladium album]|nr:hypothetical protein PWT90_10006 [Aphanocladium album]